MPHVCVLRQPFNSRKIVYTRLTQFSEQFTCHPIHPIFPFSHFYHYFTRFHQYHRYDERVSRFFCHLVQMSMMLLKILQNNCKLDLFRKFSEFYFGVSTLEKYNFNTMRCHQQLNHFFFF